MDRPPRDTGQPLLTRELAARIGLVGFLLLLGSFGLFNWELQQGNNMEEARTCAVNVFVCGELFYLFNCRSLRHSMRTLGFFSNRWLLAGASLMILLQLMFTYMPVMNSAFGSKPIGLREWGLILAASFVIYLVIEAEKSWRAGKPD